MLALFVITLFLGSSLLFLVQPMFAKMVLPLLGGTPAVWNTCMVFFQAALLGGYLYAHLSTKWLGVRKQALLHIVVLLVPLIVLPLAVPEGWSPPSEGNPIWWLLLLLTVAIGLPFFVVSSSAPLLQKWFSATGHHSAHDPYFLYAASNLGSMLALLAYPVLVEPTLKLGEQSAWWSWGYGGLVVMTSLCVVALWMAKRGAKDELPGSAPVAPKETTIVDGPLTWSRRLKWIALAAVPSSLMLGVTTYITTDIAVVPLLWIIPLALYLLTFILVFARRKIFSHRWMARIFPIAVIILLLVLLSEATRPVTLIVAGHLLAFFLAAMVCHGELARDRPPASHLTEFYLLMSVGGVLGGIFNALLAPALFISIAEYPIALVAACLLSPQYRLMFATSPEVSKKDVILRISKRLADYIYPLLLGAAAIGLVLLANYIGGRRILSDPERLALIGGAPALLCFLFSERPIRFGLSIGVVLFAGTLSTANHGQVFEAYRSFFAVHRVTRNYIWRELDQSWEGFNLLYHGTTLHGRQLIDFQTKKPTRSDMALAYYHRKGPIGQVFEAYQGEGRFQNVGVVGLGGGGLLAYAQEGQRFTCFEIDPVVAKLANRKDIFTFLSDARGRGAEVEIILGDARLTLADIEDHSLDLLVLDAFSSDSIPVHLLTKEALKLYLTKLAEGGVIAFHISNRYLDLDPVMANLAAETGIQCFIQHDVAISHEEMIMEYRLQSTWAIMARNTRDFAPLDIPKMGSPWIAAEPDPSKRVWTDDYSNILSVFIWGD